MKMPDWFLPLVSGVLLWVGCSEAVPAPALPGTGKINNDIAFERQTPVVLAYQKTHKAVVNISGRRLVRTSIWPGFDWPDIFGDDFFFGPRYRKAELVVLGSGVVVHEDGYMVTNAHVVKDTDKIKVTFSNGREHPAEIVSADESKDLAVLKIDADSSPARRKAGKLPFIHLGRSDDLMIGETAIAIGNPFGYKHTLTTGVISALGRDIEVVQGFWLRGLIQTSAPINRGNSGGPLLNINGELIGINTAINPQAQNIGFAIPVDTLADNLIHMLMPEKLRRVRLGLVIGRVKKLGEHCGLVVDSVVKDSPADKKGIEPGDLLLEIDNKKLTSFIDFYVKMMGKEVGQPIVMEYIRPGEAQPKKRTAKLTMAPRPLPDGKELVAKFFQMEVSELTETVAQKFGFASAYPVLIVTDVQETAQAAQAGVEPGDLILEINGGTVSNLKELALEMEKISEGDTVAFNVLRIITRGGFEFRRQYTLRLKAKATKKKKYRFL